jgi:hypothetical protein
VSAQLLVFFKDDKNFGSGADNNIGPKNDSNVNIDAIQQPILALTYAALILSIGATITSLILTNEFSNIPIRAARSMYDLESSNNAGETRYLGGNRGVLRLFGLRKSAVFIMGHCESCALQLGVKN